VVGTTISNETLHTLWSRITEGLRLRRVPAGQYILRKDTMPVDIFFLQTGRVKMGDVDTRRNEKILHLLHPPAVLPLTFFSGQSEPTHWYYASLTDCELFVVPHERLQTYLRSDGELAVALMSWFSQEVHELLVRLSSLENSNVREKVMAALRFLVAYHAKPVARGWYRVVFPVSHQLLANMTGVRRESVTQQLGRLQQEGIVSTTGFATLEMYRPGLSD
jgi:CRP-like cAMP-binding protein